MTSDFLYVSTRLPGLSKAGRLASLVDLLDFTAPLHLQEDNAGLALGGPN